MSNLSNRIAKLEKKNVSRPAVLIYPACEPPDHDFASDTEYYKSLVRDEVEHEQFDVWVFHPDATRGKLSFIVVEDVPALLKDISRKSWRIGDPPELRAVKEAIS